MMSSNRILISALAGISPIFFASSALADNWKTSDGKIYQDVKVISVSPDRVTILHQDGGASVPLATLPADLQKRFYYDPAKAQAAADDRARQAAAAKMAMRERELEAEQLLSVGDGTSTSTQVAPDSSTPTGPVASSSAVITQTGTQDFADTLTGIPLTAPVSPSHHAVSEVTESAQTTRHDLGDPAYHTMAHLQYMIRTQGLRPDPTDPNHHTMDEIGH